MPTRPSSGAQSRGDRTRAAVVDEAVRCVLEEGFAAASAKHVAERAGVTWGVVQYHFGDRNGILAAVVEAGYRDTLERLAAVRVSGATTREQVTSVVDAAWAAFSSPTARAGFEILVATRPHREARHDARLAQVGQEFYRLGALLSRAQPQIGELMFTALRGLVLNQMMLRGPMDTSRERGVLVEVLSTFLDHTTPSGPSDPSGQPAPPAQGATQ